MSLEFKVELQNLINRCSKENESNTPDFILAEYLLRCLENFDHFTQLRDEWWGVKHKIGGSVKSGFKPIQEG